MLCYKDVSPMLQVLLFVMLIIVGQSKSQDSKDSQVISEDQLQSCQQCIDDYEVCTARKCIINDDGTPDQRCIEECKKMLAACKEKCT